MMDCFNLQNFATNRNQTCKDLMLLYTRWLNSGCNYLQIKAAYLLETDVFLPNRFVRGMGFVMLKILLDSIVNSCLFSSSLHFDHVSSELIQLQCTRKLLLKMVHILWNDSQNVSWMIIFVCLFVYISLENFLRKCTRLNYWWSSSQFYLYPALTAPELCKICANYLQRHETLVF